MRRIEAAKLREQCESLLDNLPPEGVTITRQGKPVARLVPLGQAGATLIGRVRGRIDVRGGLESSRADRSK